VLYKPRLATFNLTLSAVLVITTGVTSWVDQRAHVGDTGQPQVTVG
jgi:hypothetical protein